MTNGRTFGKADQYGTTIPKIGYPQLFSKVHKNRCA
jgi:hypothetical protein